MSVYYICSRTAGDKLAPPNVVHLFGRTFAAEPMLELTARAEELATAYLQAGVVSGRYVDDARHVAIATTHGVGVLISWNFRHLVNYRRESGWTPKPIITKKRRALGFFD